MVFLKAPEITSFFMVIGFLAVVFAIAFFVGNKKDQ
jgi:hypothetical protein